MATPTNDACAAMKERMEEHRKEYEKNMADARRSDQEATRYVAINNDMVKQVQREVALLGIN